MFTLLYLSRSWSTNLFWMAWKLLLCTRYTKCMNYLCVAGGGSIWPVAFFKGVAIFSLKHQAANICNTGLEVHDAHQVVLSWCIPGKRWPSLHCPKYIRSPFLPHFTLEETVSHACLDAGFSSYFCRNLKLYFGPMRGRGESKFVFIIFNYL